MVRVEIWYFFAMSRSGNTKNWDNFAEKSNFEFFGLNKSSKKLSSLNQKN